MWNIFKNWFTKEKSISNLLETPEYFTGALLDTRKPEEKTNDIQFKDIVGTANAVNWNKTSYRSFPPYNQNQSYSCGANALAKALGIAYSTRYGVYVPFSRVNIYQRRYGAPSAGMTLWDMFNIISNGVTLEQLTPETFNTDADIDKIFIDQFKKDVGAVFKTTGGVYLPNDIDLIASTIQTTGKGVILLTWFTASEWSAKTPVIQNRWLGSSDPTSIRHFVVAVDYVMFNGMKYLVIEDSAWFGGYNQRLVSEDWVKNRISTAAYPMNFKFTITNVNRSYDGMTIISAQKCLQDLGFFPTNVAFAEVVGNVTRQSLIKFQAKYGLAQTGTLSDETKIKLHQLFP